MARVSQWLTSRNQISDWNTDRRTEAGSKTSLEYQSESVSSHPLPMGVQQYCMGLFPVGARVEVESSRFYSGLEQNLLDVLSTEEFSPLVTEDTGEGIGLG